MPVSDEPQVLIIGAGAAGLAAARRLRAAGVAAAVLEARERIGGRVVTSYDLAAHPVELGAEFIHGDRVITWDFVEQFDLETLETFADDEAQRFHLAGELLSYDELVDHFGADPYEALDDAASDWAEDEDEDASLADVLEDLTEDEPLSEAERRLINNGVAPDNGADLDELGVFGYDELTYDGDGEGDFRIEAGYTRLIEALAEGLDVRLGAVVERIAWGEAGAQVTLRSGEVLTAQQVIVTLPLGVLQAGDVRFDPPLPGWKQQAIDGLGAGHVDKIILKFDAPFWPAGLEAVITAADSQMWWRPGWGRSAEEAVLTALVGGAAAFRFEAMGEQQVINAALADLEGIFQVSNLRARLVEGRFIAWGTDPFSRMGYSYVPVEGAGLRNMLAEPVEDVLFFAGEATNATHAATVHGALMSGERAADQLLDAL